LEEIKKGANPGQLQYRELNFRPGWHGLRQKPYPGPVRLVGLDRVTGLRHFPYPGVVGLAGLGQVTARVTGLRHFPYPGVVGLAGLCRVTPQVTGLSSGKAKTSPRAGFSLIPQPELG
jgi:hypothetical protein